MASFTTITERKRSRRHKNAGSDRKTQQGKRSTLSYAELFAGFGAPGEPAPAGTASKIAAKAG